jgi:hypothetical protein
MSNDLIVLLPGVVVVVMAIVIQCMPSKMKAN